MLSIALGCFLVSAAPNDDSDKPKNEWSPRVKAVLQNPDRVELIAHPVPKGPLPEPDKRDPRPYPRFHGSDILSRANLDAAAWKLLLAALEQGLAEPKADPKAPAKPFGNGLAPIRVDPVLPEAFGVRLVRGNDVVGLYVGNKAVEVWLNDDDIPISLTLHFDPTKAFRAAARAAKLPEADRDPIPAAYREVLEKADKLELLSLQIADPEDAEVNEFFHGNAILGRTTLTKNQRQQALATLYDGTKEIPANAGCFIPRHGLRATHDGITVGLVICFECGKIKLYYGESGDTYATSVSRTPAKLFNLILSDAKVPLPKQPAEPNK